MLDLEAVPNRYEDAVLLLANWHRDRDDRTFAAYSFPDPRGNEVRIVEVSERFPRTEEVRPVRFGRSAEFPFPSAVALVSAQDWLRVLSGFLTLPEGWPLEGHQKVPLDDQE